MSPLMILFAMAFTLLVLITGIVLMVKGGTLNQQYSNKLMTLRVVGQAVALASLAALAFCSASGS